MKDLIFLLIYSL